MRVNFKTFLKDLKEEISDHNVSNGAAALAYYLMLAVFPAAIFFLSLLAYLPIADLDQAIMDSISSFLPQSAANVFTKTIHEITVERKGGLLSFGLLFTIWSASSGMVAIMEQLNITYDVKEGRPFWKVRGIAFFLILLFGVLIIGALGLTLFGDQAENALASAMGASQILLTTFTVLKWSVIVLALSLGFALTYYFGPDVEQKFKFITPGSAMGVLMLTAASLGFRFYVNQFGDYNVTYGSLGAVIVLMLWLYITGLVILLGSEINSLIEHYSPDGKFKGEKTETATEFTF